MKRFSAAFAFLVLACLAPLGIQSVFSSASALTCDPYVVRTKTQNFDPAASGVIKWTMESQARKCVTSGGDDVFQVRRNTIQLDWTSGGCGTVGDILFEHFGFIQGGNQPSESKICDGSSMTKNWWYPSPGVDVWVCQGWSATMTGRALGINIWSDLVLSSQYCP